MTRLLPTALLALVLALTGCSSDDGGDGSDGGSGSSADPQAERVGISGITFEVPEDWTVLDSDEMTEGAADAEEMQQFKDDMGLSDEQLQQTLDSVGLYLVTGEGASGGFLDNIVGTEVEGSMPNESQLEAEFLALGAEVVSVEQVETDGGEASRIAYELPSGNTTVMGQALSLPTDGSVVTFTVSAAESDTSAGLMDGIVETLATE
jgi:hypothetical protein